MNWNPPRWVPGTKFFFKVFFRLTIYFLQEQTKFVQGTTFVRFFMYCKAKKKFGVNRKFLKFFIFKNLLHKKGLKGGISIDADSGPPRYLLWCCDGICHQVLTFIQVGCGHTVPETKPWKASLGGFCKVCSWNNFSLVWWNNVDFFLLLFLWILYNHHYYPFFISCSSHVNNQSWILNLHFSFLQARIFPLISN